MINNVKIKKFKKMQLFQQKAQNMLPDMICMHV